MEHRELGAKAEGRRWEPGNAKVGARKGRLCVHVCIERIALIISALSMKLVVFQALNMTTA